MWREIQVEPGQEGYFCGKVFLQDEENPALSVFEIAVLTASGRAHLLPPVSQVSDSNQMHRIE